MDLHGNYGKLILISMPIFGGNQTLIDRFVRKVDMMRFGREIIDMLSEYRYENKISEILTWEWVFENYDKWLPAIADGMKPYINFVVWGWVLLPLSSSR